MKNLLGAFAPSLKGVVVSGIVSTVGATTINVVIDSGYARTKARRERRQLSVADSVKEVFEESASSGAAIGVFALIPAGVASAVTHRATKRQQPKKRRWFA